MQGSYRVVYADPPWNFKTYSAKGEGRSAKKHYSTISLDDIEAIIAPVPTYDDATLFMWVTWPFLRKAMNLVERLEWEYKGLGFDWMKVKDGKPQMGMGYVTRGNTEPCLRFTRGNPGLPKSRGIHSAIMEPRREHSRKPDCAYERIEALYDGPYLELFARTKRAGWDQFGNEVGKFQDDSIRKEPIPA